MVDTLILNTSKCLYRNSPPKVFYKKRYSKFFYQIHREAPTAEYFLKTFAGKACHCTLDRARLYLFSG